MKTNSKEVKKAIQLHLIEIAQNDDEAIETTEQAIKYISRGFNSWINRYEMRHHKTIQDAFIYWLSGLPLHTHYYTDDIITYLHSIGLYGKDKKQEETKASYLYHYLIFKECYNEISNNLDWRILS